MPLPGIDHFGYDARNSYILQSLHSCMDWAESYKRSKSGLLGDDSIAAANRELFREFFEFEEYKLKRRNGLSSLDRGCYRTLLTYITRVRAVNRWFGNKAWTELTESDIKSVYDALEEGRITTARGQPVGDKASYYNKILRGKLFELAGKADLARKVLSHGTAFRPPEVAFITEQTFRELVEATASVEHRLLLWLCFDTGENATALLALRKQDCLRQVPADTGEPEYRINLRRETLKRSRRPRSELTNYRETVQYLDQVLARREDGEALFRFGPAQAAKLLRRAVRITGIRCQPAGRELTLKDLRSSMACDLLSKGWSTDEVNARLGHKPSSRELDKYVNFLALKGERPKRKFRETQITVLVDKLEALQQREKLHTQRQERLREDVERLQKRLDEQNRQIFTEVKRLVKTHLKGGSSRDRAA